MEISLGMCVFWGFEGQDVMIFNACMHACMHACMYFEALERQNAKISSEIYAFWSSGRADC